MIIKDFHVSDYSTSKLAKQQTRIKCISQLTSQGLDISLVELDKVIGSVVDHPNHGLHTRSFDQHVLGCTTKGFEQIHAISLSHG